MKLNLPKKIKVDDYHEFSYLEEYFKLLNRHIKIEEVGSIEGNYVGVVYTKKDKEYKKLKSSLTNVCDKW